jgi:Zn-dependent protease with chaperone function
LKLDESTPSLSAICRAVEARLEGVEELASLKLPLVLLPDFDSLPEANLAAAIRLTPTAYQRLERRILVNAATFSTLQEDVAEAVLAHEIGHALCHRDSIMERATDYRFLGECIVADLLACKWGFFDALKKERLKSNGPQYSQILGLWSDEGEFVRRMTEWYQVRLCGLA